MIASPTLLLDVARCRSNILWMAAKARQHGLSFRPHFKTHQSLLIGDWFREAGVEKITVSSVKMAEYFAAGPWDDITIAIPVNVLEIGAINRLASRIRLNLVLESVETATILNRELKFPVGIFLKIDAGYHRTGIDASDFVAVGGVLSAVGGSPLMKVKGFLAHAGNTYHAPTPEEVVNIHRQSVDQLVRLKNHFADRFPGLIVSVGDTPSCSLAADFNGVDEIRPGNFVFYDLMQLLAGTCNPNQVAVAMACPVVALHPERRELVIHGGSVHFSKEYVFHPRYGPIFGIAMTRTPGGWGEPLEEVYLRSLSQEHGIVSAPPQIIEQVHVGDIMHLLPVHSCLTADCMRGYSTTCGMTIARL